MDSIRYIWSGADEKIAKGNIEGSVQGPYVTPYGLPASSVPGCGDFKAQAEYDVDVSEPNAGEPWRRVRFKEGKPYYQWEKIDSIPDSVTTLADLCKHLREKDPVMYPASIYGDELIANLKHPDNPAKLLFDYWKNTKYRAAVVKDGFDTYANAPGSIAVRSGGVALEYVLQKLTPVATAAVAPGAQKKSVDELAAAVGHYISEVSASTANIRTLLKTSETVMKERYQVIYQLQALRAVAEASATAPQDGAASQGAEAVALVDKILPKAHKLLVTQPIRSGSTEQQIADLFKSRREFTMNAVADLAAEATRLDDLLLKSSAHKDTLQSWTAATYEGLLQGAPAVVDMIERLTGVLADAHLALAECAGDGHVEVLKALLDKMPASHPTTRDGIGGDSPTAVVLSVVGKGASLDKTLAKNLSGPPKLWVGLLQVYGVLKFQSIAKGALDSVSHLQVDYSDLHGVSEIETLWHLENEVDLLHSRSRELSDYLIHAVDDSKLREDLRLAVLGNNKEALTKLKDDYGKAMAGSVKNTLAWKGSMVLLNLLSLIVAMNGAKASTKATYLVIIDDCSTVAKVASISLGTFETLMTAMARLDPVAKALSSFGNGLGAFTAILGIISGSLSYIDAVNKGDGYGAVSAAFGVLGSTGIAIVSLYALAGITMPVLAAISLACLIASGAVSIVQLLLEKGTDTNRVCSALVATVRTSLLGKFMEGADAVILLGMEDLEKLAKEGALPNVKSDPALITKLAKAGLPLATINEIMRVPTPSTAAPSTTSS